MKRGRFTAYIGVLAVGGVLVSGCGDKHEGQDGHGHANKKDGHGHEEEPASGASFKAGTGVILTEETRRSIGVETAEVTEGKLPLELRFNAQVFGENHKASAEVLSGDAVVTKPVEKLWLIELRATNEI